MRVDYASSCKYGKSRDVGVLSKPRRPESGSGQHLALKLLIQVRAGLRQSPDSQPVQSRALEGLEVSWEIGTG